MSVNLCVAADPNIQLPSEGGDDDLRRSAMNREGTIAVFTIGRWDNAQLRNERRWQQTRSALNIINGGGLRTEAQSLELRSGCRRPTLAFVS